MKAIFDAIRAGWTKGVAKAEKAADEKAIREYQEWAKAEQKAREEAGR